MAVVSYLLSNPEKKVEMGEGKEQNDFYNNLLREALINDKLMPSYENESSSVLENREKPSRMISYSKKMEKQASITESLQQIYKNA